MKSSLPFSIFVLVACAGAASAQDRNELKAACREYVQKYCANVQREPTVIKQCLLAQKDKLSPGCRAVVDRR
jgi:hypothetical protein